MDSMGHPMPTVAGNLFRRWFSRIFPKPRIFISYAREDAALATWLFDELGKSGFDVYLDTSGTLAGEQFLPVIVQHLRRCDAVIALVSLNSTTSAWCQAELYYAHALRRIVLPIRISARQELALPAPLELLQRETQYIFVDEEGGNTGILAAVKQRFRVVRRRAHWLWLRRALVGASAIAILAWGFHSGIYTILRARERAKIVTRIERTQVVLSRDVVEATVRNFRNDEPLRASLLFIAEDPERPTNTRLNARIIAAALGSREKRWYLESIQWSNSDFHHGELTDITFRTGTVRGVTFSKVTLSGVVWNQGSDFSISGTTFAGCRFYGGEFGHTSVIDTDFQNCVFFGTTLEISGFGAVRFSSKGSKPESEVITDGELLMFENSIIANCTEPPPTGTLDFGGPKTEVEFTGVVFESCRFRGFIRPTWFVGCHFSRCMFPTSLAISDLEKRGNTATQCFNMNEPCE